MKSVLLTSCVFLTVAVVSGTRGALPQSFSGQSNSAPSTFVLPLHASPIYGPGRWSLEPTIVVAAGTPPQPVRLILDTGSDLPVFYNTSCTVTDCGPRSTPKYDSSLSSTAKVQRTHGKQTYQYQAGNVTGYFGSDTISFMAPNSQPFFDLKDQEMLMVTNVSWRKNQAGLDQLPEMAGILGLGPTDTNGFVQALLNQGLEMMTVRLERGSGMKIPASSFPRSGSSSTTTNNADDRQSSSPGVIGHVQFGGYDLLNPEKKEPTWAKNSEIGLPNWVIYIQDVLANGKSTGQCGGKFCQAMFDTGAGEINLDGAQLPHIPVNAVANCSDEEAVRNLPNITFVISNVSFTMEPMDYLLRLPNGSCQSVIGQVSDGEQLMQRVGVQKGKFRDALKKNNNNKRSGEMPGTSSPFSAAALGYAWFDIGLQFTSRITTIYDFKNLRMGFIQHD